MRLFYILTCGLLLLNSTIATAETAVDSNDSAMQGLLQSLAVETDIATKTKMNADFVPGMVTVLQGDELEALGYKNVWESLALVPGLHLNMSSVGTYKVTFRGIGGAFGAAKYKFLVDGMPAHSTMTGTSSAYHIDVAQVERVEIIRGPGSAIYGGLAYTGVINVVMRKNVNRGSIRYGSFNTLQMSAMVSDTSDDGLLAWHINTGTWRTDGANPLSGPDGLYSSVNAALNQATSKAPGLSNEQVQSSTLNAGVSYKDFSIQALYLDVNKADHFGFSSVLPTADQAGFIDYQDFTLQAKQRIDINDANEFDMKLEYRTYDIHSHFLLAQPGFKPPAAGGALVLPQGMITNLSYGENKYSAGMSLLNHSLENHDILLGVDYSQISTRNISQTSNFNPANIGSGNQPVQTYTGAGNWLKPGISRQNTALYIQDQIEMGTQTTVTLGVRHDHFDDVGDSTNPRIAMVYRLDEKHMLKAQIATAFRPPTFVEMYSQNNPAFNANTNIKPEKSQNFELGYVYRDHHKVARLTLYQTHLIDMIILDAGTPKTYQNIGKAQVYGAELEAEIAWNKIWKVKANISYNQTKDQQTQAAIEGAADWLGNVVVDYELMQDYTFALWGRYVGQRHRAVTDTRPLLASETTLDLSGDIANLGLNGLNFRAGVKNVFDQNIRFPSATTAYFEDLPRTGRTWWAQTSYTF